MAYEDLVIGRVAYELSTQAPCHPYSYLPTNNPDDAAESPWHFEPKKEFGRPVERATIIYAHADDETIFTGGLMLAYPEWEWTLLRMTGNNGPEREAEHDRAIAAFKDQGVNIVQAHCFNGTDEYLPWIGRVHWAMALAKMRGNPDVVFTHGIGGEYGHPHHVALHHIVHTLYDNVWYFYHPSDLPHSPQLLMGRVHYVPTDGRKLAIMEKAYTHAFAGLKADAPELVRAQFSGEPEFYTR